MPTRIRRILAAALLASATTLAACSREERKEAVNEPTANEGMASEAAQTAPLINGAGQPIGEVAVSEDANGVTLRISAAGLPRGVHGIHLHEAGLCEGPDFKSAGAHWNPAKRQHGRDNPLGAHLGDLANFEVAGSGQATTTFLVGGVSRSGGAEPLADADGTSLVIHAKADDYKTDPSGNSGDRVACAVLAAPRAP